MRDKNTQIIDEVKKHIKATKTNKSSSKNDLKDKDVVEVLDSKKTKSLDSMIEKEIKDWINLNAEKISKEIIQETVKKLFK